MTFKEQVHRSVAVPANVVGQFPCTQQQLGFWVLEKMHPGGSSANIALRWELVGPVRVSSIEDAFRKVIARHEILRTRFPERDGLPVQEVVEHVDFRLSTIDLRNIAAEQVDERIAAISREEACTPFDLDKPGLIRATLLRTTIDRACLLITVHHLCFDGWSIRLLGREIGTIAARLESGQEPDLPDLAVQYGDYALWQQEFTACEAFERETRYWRDKLAGAPYFEVPTDRPRRAERSYRGRLLSRLLPPEASALLEKTARARGLSVFAVGAAVLSAMLHRFTGQSDITVSTQLAGRNEIDVENLIGVFINNLMLRFDLSGDPTGGDHIVSSGRIVSEALQHQRVSFNKLVEVLNPPRDPARTPFASVNLVIQQAFLEDGRYGGFELHGRPSETPGALYDLNFIMVGRSEGWRTSLEYNPDLYDDETAESLLRHWQDAFETMLANPQLRVSVLASRAGRLRPQDPASKSPSGIEALLNRHPEVAEAVVVPDAVSHSSFAFVVPSPGATTALERLPSTLMRFLEGRVPKGDMPTGISILLQLPRDPSGGIRWNALRVPDHVPVAGLPLEQPDQTGISAMEEQVRAVWCDLLGIQSIGRADSFFDLGGHSLLAVRMISRLRDKLNLELSTTTVYECPTLEGLAARLHRLPKRLPSNMGGQDASIVEINGDADGIPIISINNYRTMYAISKRLSSQRRIIAVRLVDPDKPFELPPLSFEAIADAYVDLVKKAQPRGPYALFGICVHGNLALEVARRLLDRGDEVAGLFIKDVWAPAYGDAVVADPRTRWLDRIHDIQVRLSKMRTGEFTAADVLSFYPRIAGSRLIKFVQKLGLLKPSEERQLLLSTSQGHFIRYLAGARNAYTPVKYPGDVLMFLTGDSPRGSLFDRSLGWSTLVEGSLDIVEIDQLVAFRNIELGMEAAAEAIENVLLATERELATAS